MSDIAHIKAKIEKLLNLSKSPNPSEAASALEKANKLLLDYNIELSEIRTSKSEVSEEIYMSGSACRDHELALINAIAHHNFCEVVSHNGYRSYSVGIIGKAHNIEATKMMCDYVFEACDKAAKTEVKGQGRAVVFSFKVGFCSAVSSKIWQMVHDRKNTSCDGPNLSTAVVLVESKKEIDDYKKEKFKNLKQFKLNDAQVKDVYAFFAGHLAGNKLNLSQQISAH